MPCDSSESQQTAKLKVERSSVEVSNLCEFIVLL